MDEGAPSWGPLVEDLLGSLCELLDLDDDLGVDFELGGVAGEWNCAGDAVPVESPVHAVQLSTGTDADALLGAERVREAALDGRLEHKRLARPLDREAAHPPEVPV